MSGGGFIHQSLHRDAHFDQAFLLQDVVRKTQFVLEEQKQGGKKNNRREEREQEREGRKKCGSRSRDRKETKAALGLVNT